MGVDRTPRDRKAEAAAKARARIEALAEQRRVVAVLHAGHPQYQRRRWRDLRIPAFLAADFARWGVVEQPR